VYFTFFLIYAAGPFRRLHRGRPATAGDRALGDGQGAVDPGAALRPCLRMGGVRDLAHASEPRSL